MFETPFAFALLLCGVSYGKRKAFIKRYSQWLDAAKDSLPPEEWAQRRMAAAIAEESVLAPHFLPKSYDVSKTYHPNVPHRTLTASAPPRQAEPLRPLEDLVRAELTRDDAATIIASHTYPQVTEFLSTCATSGHWLAALRITKEREALRGSDAVAPVPRAQGISARVNNALASARRSAEEYQHIEKNIQEHASSADVECTLRALMVSQRRNLLLRLFLQYKPVPLNPAVYAELLDFFFTDRKGSIIVIDAIRQAGVEFNNPRNDDEARLMQSYIRTVTRYDWVEALRFYQYDVTQEGDPTIATGRGAEPLRPSAVAELFKGIAMYGDDTAIEHLYKDLLLRFPSASRSALLAGVSTKAGLNLSKDFLSAHSRALLVGAESMQHDDCAAGKCSSIRTSWEAALMLFSSARAASQNPIERSQTAGDAGALVDAVLLTQPSKWKVLPPTLALASVPAPSQEETLAAVSRSVVASRHWQMALHVSQIALSQRRYGSVPALAGVVASRQRWALALQLTTRLLAQRRTAPVTDELALCVHSSVNCGKWNSALFWIERAHTKGLRFPCSVYDAAFAGSARGASQWQATLRVLAGMTQVGGECSQDGLSAVLTTAGRHRQATQVLDILDGSVEWVE